MNNTEQKVLRYDIAAPDRRRLVTMKQMIEDISLGAWNNYSVAYYIPALLGEELAASLTEARTLKRAHYTVQSNLLKAIAKVHKDARHIFNEISSEDILKIRRAADDCLALRSSIKAKEQATMNIARRMAEELNYNVVMQQELEKQA